MAINTINGALVDGIPIANVTGLQAALDAAGGGTLAIANITGLQTALDGKAATSHTHTASQIYDSTTVGRAMLTAATAAAQALLLPVVTRSQRGMVPTAPSGTGTTKFLREDQTWADPVAQNVVSDIRLGTFVARNDSSGTSHPAGSIVIVSIGYTFETGYFADPTGFRPIQKNVNGSWVTVTSI